MTKVTIKDIAREAGVSISAVSLVLNNRPSRISDETKQQIIKIAKKYKYQANPIAQSMVTKQTYTLGVVIPDIENIFFSSLVKVLENCCQSHGYMILIVNSDDLLRRESTLIEHLKARQIDGLFLVPANEAFYKQEKALNIYSQIDLPLVFIDRIFPGTAYDSVSFDNEQGAYEAVCHLISQGHRRIGCISLPALHSNGKCRLNGYKKAMSEHNLPMDPDFLYYGDFHMDSGYLAAQTLLTHTTAVFSTNDMMALGFLKYLGEQEVLVPRDYAVVGYDDVANQYLINLELTSVSQDILALGTQACSIMLDRLRGENGGPQILSLKPSLVIRESSVMPAET